MRTKTTVRRVAEAVVALLREPLSDKAHRTLGTFQLKEWESCYHWLDANGLALYFRHVVRANKVQCHIPSEVLARLDGNYLDNRCRLEHQLIEFRVLNRGLKGAGIRYANLKGFTLEPDYCPDLSLRYQCDLDLMVHRNDGHRCRLELEQLGYRLTSETVDTLEFRAPEDRVPDIADLYKPRRQQTVEVHFGSPLHKLDLHEDCLDRLVWANRAGISFPRLSDADQFLALIFHLYRHLLSEWVRLSWFYELGQCLQRRANDSEFWLAISGRAEADRQTAQALALVLAFTRQAFTPSVPRPLAEICSESLNKSAQLWILHYGREMLFSDFPGNKLYLLLLREISTNHGEWRDISRKRLLPFHAPGRALYSVASTERMKQIPGNTLYGVSRAWFHAREGFRYLREQWRWKHRAAQAALLDSGSE